MSKREGKRVEVGAGDGAVARRDLLRAGLGAGAALFVLPQPMLAMVERAIGFAATESSYLDAAIKAGRWIDRLAIRLPTGTVWPSDAANAKSVQTSLYSGTPGVVLFFLELHNATGDRRWLSRAEAGAEHLSASLPDGDAKRAYGLYEGLSGIAFTLEQVHRVSQRPRFGDAAARALSMVRMGARHAGAGVEWNDSTDVISGSAGIGLTLLWANAQLSDALSLHLAVEAGKRLIELGRPEKDGIKWAMSPGFARTMPNFAHGTGGVAFFLASLFERTKEQVFLDAALGGARYLQTIATRTPNDGRKIFHSEPGNETLYYLSWCHGPAGTARLFEKLASVTGDASHRAYVQQLARGIVDSGVPERSAGFWNNISQCCGNCGIANFFVALSESSDVSNEDAKTYRTFAQRVTEDTIQRASADGDGLKWIQAEHRVRPELLQAQTGLMQGAAGVGLTLLRMDRTLSTRLPDA